MLDKLKKSFVESELKDQFEPDLGHRNRFMDKLDSEMNHKAEGLDLHISFKLMRIAAVAAILITAVSFAWFWDQTRVQSTFAKPMSLADVSEKYQEVEFFYQEQMVTRLAQIEMEDNEEDKLVYKEAINKLKRLDVDYANLENDLSLNPGNSRVVYAMIKNYQLRITVLETLLLKLNIKETQKIEENEKANIYPIFPVGIHLVPHTA